MNLKCLLDWLGFTECFWWCWEKRACSLKAVTHLCGVTWLTECVTVPHALCALCSLQGNRCQPSCAPGFYHDTQEGTCKPCHTACATCAGKCQSRENIYKCSALRSVLVSTVASGAGSEACSLCAEGFFTEEWRCVSSCSPGFYSTEPSPENADGQRICRRWAHCCVLRCGCFVYQLMAGRIWVVGFLLCLLLCALAERV